MTQISERSVLELGQCNRTMDDQRDEQRSWEPPSKVLRRFGLKWLLIVFIPLSIALAFYYRYLQQQARIQNACDRLSALVFDAHFNHPSGDMILWPRNGNVTDNDLSVLTPLFSGEVPMGGHKIIRLELRGSQVSDEAVETFRRAAPECELVR